ncbi:MAG: WbqC family protein [Prevotella sp.]|nr:WbqC family protein [Prevotella sp.]
MTPLHKGRGEPREARRGGGALLSTTYFGPVQWYQKLNRHRCIIEQHDNFVKQTYRNRCVIASANGPQSLTVPIERYDGMKCAMRDIRISDHGNWRHLHWQALVSAYGETPFFEYYADDIRPFFEEHRWKYLLDFNLDITHALCSLLDVRPDLTLSDHYIDADETICGSGSLSGAAAGLSEAFESFGGAVKGLNGAAESLGSSSACSLFVDYRDAIRPKHPLPDAEFEARPYYQVRAQRHGFLPNLSVLDLLFNEGPEGIFWLL